MVITKLELYASKTERCCYSWHLRCYISYLKEEIHCIDCIAKQKKLSIGYLGYLSHDKFDGWKMKPFFFCSKYTGVPGTYTETMLPSFPFCCLKECQNFWYSVFSPDFSFHGGLWWGHLNWKRMIIAECQGIYLLNFHPIDTAFPMFLLNGNFRKESSWRAALMVRFSFGLE